MSEGFISRGFRGRRRPTKQGTQLPPGQYLVEGFPVLSAGPTPRTPLDQWDFSIVGEVDELGDGPGRSSARCQARRSRPTSTASPSGQSWAPGGKEWRSEASSTRWGRRLG